MGRDGVRIRKWLVGTCEATATPRRTVDTSEEPGPRKRPLASAARVSQPWGTHQGEPFKSRVVKIASCGNQYIYQIPNHPRIATMSAFHLHHRRNRKATSSSETEVLPI